ncbi:MAG TPA: hypothetical protein PLA68_11880 [Panacibacter sp.]|nr:hypothetical protein [Panacibacter sp.]
MIIPPRVIEFLKKYDRVWEGENGMYNFCELLNATCIEIKEEKGKPL